MSVVTLQVTGFSEYEDNGDVDRNVTETLKNTASLSARRRSVIATVVKRVNGEKRDRRRRQFDSRARCGH